MADLLDSDFVEQLAARALMRLERKDRVELLQAVCSTCGGIVGKVPAALVILEREQQDALDRCDCPKDKQAPVRIIRALLSVHKDAKRFVDDYHCAGALSALHRGDLVLLVRQGIYVAEQLLALAKKQRV